MNIRWLLLSWFWVMILDGEELVLVRDGRSDYVIVTAENAPESVREAALELQRLIGKSTGVKLPVTHRKPLSAKAIYLGKQPGPWEDRKFERDAFVIAVHPPALWIVGNDEVPVKSARRHQVTQADFLKFYNICRWRESLSAGTYNGVIEFCRRFLGARWYMPTEAGE
ncbi:MAG: hypothetical protein D6820_14765, partial [Lentisphaerae bacterium]